MYEVVHPAPGRPLWQARSPQSTRGPRWRSWATPTRDRCCSPPAARTASSRRRSPARPTSATAASPAVTDIHEFPGKGHLLALDGGWEEVAVRRARLAPLPATEPPSLLGVTPGGYARPRDGHGRGAVAVPPPLADEGFHPAVAAWFCAGSPTAPPRPSTRGGSTSRPATTRSSPPPPGRARRWPASWSASTSCTGPMPGASRWPGPRWPTCPRSRPWPSTSRRTWSAPARDRRGGGRAGLRPPTCGWPCAPATPRPASRPPWCGARRFVVTTPESLYLLVTAARSRAMLATVETVIVDEIHAVARDKRGPTWRSRSSGSRGRPPPGPSASACPPPAPHRAGRRPAVRRRGPGRAPSSTPGTAAASTWPGAAPGRARAGGLGRADGRRGRPHRRPGGRAPHHHRVRQHPPPGRAPGPPAGREAGRRRGGGPPRSLSKTGATGSRPGCGPATCGPWWPPPRWSWASTSARSSWCARSARPAASPPSCSEVGRANHSRHGGLPRAGCSPHRDELVESAAAGRRAAGRARRPQPPDGPLDILAQQLVAEVAAVGEEGWRLDELYDLVRAPPLPPPDPRGVRRGRGHGGAYRPGAPGRLPAPRRRQRRGRAGPGPPAVTSGAPSPRSATSGWFSSRRSCSSAPSTRTGRSSRWPATSSCWAPAWQIRQVTAGTVRVVDAAGKPPRIPFWTGEAPARTAELSRRCPGCGPRSTSAWRRATAAAPATGCGAGPLDDAAVEQIVGYMAAGRAVLGVVPTHDDLVFERFFDDAEGMHLVIHSPYGGRVNRALGLALRKRFCTSTSSCRRRPTTTPWSSRWGRTTTSPWPTCPVLSTGTVRTVLTRRSSTRRCSRAAGGGTSTGAGRAALEGWAPQPAADPAHGVRRPHGRAPRRRRLPGEHHRPHRDPRSPAGPPDGARHPDRGPRHRGPHRPARRGRDRAEFGSTSGTPPRRRRSATRS